ncbi:MAG: threonylcarbamoyl-AMP synthase [Desulfobacteraceae bacterium]|nr:threonylcarbamoyl-AMP synthase [Desulfobacteraceae bacterium]MBC2750168.1 threonylcarbamoyl-AMP synthase [Desulfobacteraceae bacterium]
MLNWQPAWSRIERKWPIRSNAKQRRFYGLSKIVAIDPAAPDAATIHRAVYILRQGGMVVVPTRHLYGLAVDALNAPAIERVFAAKQRPLDQPLLILVAARDDVRKYAQAIDAKAGILMDAFWPGRLTVILDARPILPPPLTGGTGRVGIRLTGHPVCQALVRSLSRPMTATSANLSGQAGCGRIEDLHPAIVAAADLILDAGSLKPGIGSTVVDVQPDAVQVLREGAVTAAAIRAALDASTGAGS